MNVQEQKALLRNSIKERLARMNPQERATESRTLCKRILENLPEGTKTICAYYPMPSEADIRPFLEELLRRNIEVFLPCFTRSSFVFRKLESLEDLAPGIYQIPEPPSTAETLDLSTPDLVLMPGVAFDKSGNRLGRGNGGFDQWLKTFRVQNPTCRIWGVAFDAQLVPSLPVEPHDQKVDAVVTARGML